MLHVLSNTVLKNKRTRGRVGIAALIVAVPALTGCEADSFFDQSVLGRWERTPTVVPILERIGSIERDDADFIQSTEVTPEDLIPVAAEFILGPGDTLEIVIRDFTRQGLDERFPRMINPRGFIEDLPRLPPIRIGGLTPSQARDAIAEAVRREDILQDPVVSVVPATVRQNTFSVFGNVSQPGTFFIPQPDFRLLEALTLSGSFSEAVPEIYVIRQIALSERIIGQPAPAPTPGTTPGTQPPPSPDRLIDLIEDLSRPQQPQPPARPAPGMLGTGTATATPARAGAQPPIDLDPAAPSPTAPGRAAQQPARQGFNWVFLNGRWVRVAQDGDAPIGGVATDGLRAEDLVTQRVIRIPTAQLVSGNRRYNIVVRPGDIIRVPVAGQGLVYLGGQVARPGTYNMPPSGRLTLLRAIHSAGGLSIIGVPERVDLTRMVGPNTQGTVRVNLRAISEGTHPDIFLKSDDLVNIGTNFWAYPIAVIRGGFRASYGFGFLLDRNFGNDVFGAPPADRLQF